MILLEHIKKEAVRWVTAGGKQLSTIMRESNDLFVIKGVL